MYSFNGRCAYEAFCSYKKAINSMKKQVKYILKFKISLE